jgi:hypothetical protein
VQKAVCSWWSELVGAYLARVWQCRQTVCLQDAICRRVVEPVAVSSEQLVHSSAVLGWGLAHITAQERSMQQQCLCRCVLTPDMCAHAAASCLVTCRSDSTATHIAFGPVVVLLQVLSLPALVAALCQRATRQEASSAAKQPVLKPPGLKPRFICGVTPGCFGQVQQLSAAALVC